MKYLSQFTSIQLQASQIVYCLLLLVLSSLFCFDVKPTSAQALILKQILPMEIHQPLFISQSSQSQSIPPNIINAVRQDLSRRTKLAENQLKFIEAKAKTWQDGCLGLAKPDQICTQALVSGWRVVFSHKHHTWIYRTDGTGRVIRLEKAQ